MMLISNNRDFKFYLNHIYFIALIYNIVIWFK